MKEISPSSNLLDKSGCSLVFTVPISNITEIAPLFKMIENKEEEGIEIS